MLKEHNFNVSWPAGLHARTAISCQPSTPSQPKHVPLYTTSEAPGKLRVTAYSIFDVSTSIGYASRTETSTPLWWYITCRCPPLVWVAM